MLIDAKDRFLHRMAATINGAMHTDSPTTMAERFSGHTTADIKKAQALAARARVDSMKNK